MGEADIQVGDKLWRAEIQFYCSAYEENYSSCGVQIHPYVVDRLSSTGLTAYLIGPYGIQNSMRVRARKRFAWPTKEEAVYSLVVRRSCNLHICKDKLKRAKMGLEAALAEAQDMGLDVGHFKDSLTKPLELL